MNISCDCIREYVEVDWSNTTLGERLTYAGLELEETITIGQSLDGVVVGEVVTCIQHPNADRLRVCTVNIGEEADLQIVCGAPNVAAGQRVPVALVGTTLWVPDRDDPQQRVALKLKKAKLRGEASEGMICAEDELGLSDDHAGIMVLAEDAPIGMSFPAYLQSIGRPYQDTVLDLNVTPNRPDATCHIGVARDVAALSGQHVHLPAVTLPREVSPTEAGIEITIDDAAGCHRYVGLVVRGVTIKPSPAWMQARLRAIGLRPRNNIVDVTNYVMHECGQPLHAFDLDQLEGGQIVVRSTTEPTTFKTLDSKERELPPNTLMICDAAHPVAIAGVMGGEHSEVTDQTTNVLIESAWFEPTRIRKTAKQLGLSTDASYRFERSIDPTLQRWAAARAAALMVATGGGQIAPGCLDVVATPFTHSTTTLRPSRIERVLGVGIGRNTIVRLLGALGFVLAEDGEDRWTVTIPAYRPDVTREIDVIEEVARLYGFDHIPEPEHVVVPRSNVASSPDYRTGLAATLVGRGLTEIVCNSMVRSETADAFNTPAFGSAGDRVDTLNPISREMASLRPSLAPGMLQVAAHNIHNGRPDIQLFEFGRAYFRGQRSDAPVSGYIEEERLGLLLSGRVTRQTWNQSANAFDIYDAKGLAVDVMRNMGVSYVESIQPQPEHGAQYRITWHTPEGYWLGTALEVAPATRGAFDIDVPVFYIELRVDLQADRAATRYEPISRFPQVVRDIAVTVSRAQAVGPMLAAIRASGGPLLRNVDVFDVYEGDRIGADLKSVAFSLSFGADRTLVDDEVDRAVSETVTSLSTLFGAILRA